MKSGRKSTKKILIKIAKTGKDIRRCFPLLKELRPHLKDESDLAARVRRQMRESGWRLIYIEDQGRPVGCASFRIAEFLARGRSIYVDDLIVSESHRGKGYADKLMNWIAATGKSSRCLELHLDSGVQRLAAHRFYHRIGLAIKSFHFSSDI